MVRLSHICPNLEKKIELALLTHFKHLQDQGRFLQVHVLKFKLDTQVLTTGSKHKLKEIIKRTEGSDG